MTYFQLDIFVETGTCNDFAALLEQSYDLPGAVINDSGELYELVSVKDPSWDYVEETLLQRARQRLPSFVSVYVPADAQGFGIMERLLTDHRGKKIEIKAVLEEDWANNWKAYFKPFAVGTRLFVSPSWEEAAVPDSRVPLSIDPSGAFGTGQHETTRLCLEQLDGLETSGKTLLDLGCGSGILGIAALLLGVKKAAFVDISENAARIAMENLAANHINPERYEIFTGDIITDTALPRQIGGGKFDIITANIVADVILALTENGVFSRFLARDGVLLASGIIGPRLNAVTDSLTKNGFVIEEIRADKDWHMIRAAFIK